MTTEALANEILLSMSKDLTTEQLQTLRNVLADKLKDVTINCTELAVSSQTNEHYLELYIACKSVEGLSRKSLKQYYNTIRRFYTTMGVDVLRCNSDHIRAYLAKLTLDGTNKRTINNYRAYLSSFFRWLADEGYIDRNIVSKIKKIKEEKRQTKELSPYDIEKIKRACINDRETALIDLLESTGMRCSEICELKMSDIDFVNKCIVIHGKGSKDRVGYFTPKFQLSLERYLNNRGYDSEYVFGATNGDHHRITDSAMERSVKRITRRAGLDGIVIHKFRHYFCTELCRRGMDIQSVQLLMGHSSIETTAKVYNHVNSKAIANDFAKYCA